jgi:hypothetical protein
VTSSSTTAHARTTAPSSREPNVPVLFRGWTFLIAALTTAAAAAVVVCYITSEDLVPASLLLAAASLAHVMNNFALRSAQT